MWVCRDASRVCLCRHLDWKSHLCFNVNTNSLLLATVLSNLVSGCCSWLAGFSSVPSSGAPCLSWSLVRLSVLGLAAFLSMPVHWSPCVAPRPGCIENWTCPPREGQMKALASSKSKVSQDLNCHYVDLNRFKVKSEEITFLESTH